MTREEWLKKQMNIIVEDNSFLFETFKHETLNISCGYGYRVRGGKDLYKLYSPEQSTGGNWEIFINPRLEQSLDVFWAVSNALLDAHKIANGLKRRDSRRIETDSLMADAYPHDALDVAKIKKQTTRMHKVTCIEDDCGFHFRTSATQILLAQDKVGGCACPVCQSDMVMPQVA